EGKGGAWVQDYKVAEISLSYRSTNPKGKKLPRHDLPVKQDLQMIPMPCDITRCRTLSSFSTTMPAWMLPCFLL
ncbi:mCG145273, partial [Mus musculus]